MFFRNTRFITALLPLFLAACASRPAPAPYPHESVLTVLGELKIFLNQDPYREAPGADLQGRNIYRVTLERLDNLKTLTPSEYSDVLAFARGECLERLGNWPAAAKAFDAAAQTSSTLVASARSRAALATRMGGLTDRAAMGKTLESYLNDLEVLGRHLDEWKGQSPPFPYSAYLLVERERALAERVKLLSDNRLVLQDAMPRAFELARRLVQENAPSRRLGEDDLLLGSLFEMLARDITAQSPPDSEAFASDAGWENMIEQARAAYTRAAQRDGDAAKPEAQARLRALDAYALRVQAMAR